MDANDLAPFPTIRSLLDAGHRITFLPHVQIIKPYAEWVHARISPGHMGNMDNAIGATKVEALQRLEDYLKLCIPDSAKD